MDWIYAWLAVTAISLIVEFCTNEIVSIWFAGGGVVAMVLAMLDVTWYVHLPVFIVLSFILMLCFRKVVLKYLDKDQEQTNAQTAFGKEYELLEEINFNKTGTIKINDVFWNAVTKTQTEVIEKGSIVRIVGLIGNKYIVEKKDKGE